MAGRNRKDTADYFSHDSDASSDEKIVYLEGLFGHTGYAVYFKFLERMVRSKNFEIGWNDVKKAIYSREFSISVTEIDEIVSECCRKEIKAFEIVDGKMFSPGLKKRMQPLLEKREYNRLKYESDKKEKGKNNKGLPLQDNSCDRNTSENNRNGPVKERKGKERKGKTTTAEKIILPDWLSAKLWQSFIDHRKSLKAKMTLHAEKLNLNKLISFHEKGCDCEDVINTSIANGWKGFFEPKDKGNKTDYSDIEYL